MGASHGYTMTLHVLGVEQLDKLESLAGDIRFRMSEAASREMLNLVNAYRYLAERSQGNRVWLVEATGSDDEQWVASVHASQESADARVAQLIEVMNDRPYPFYSAVTGEELPRATEWIARARELNPGLEWAEDAKFQVSPWLVRT